MQFSEKSYISHELLIVSYERRLYHLLTYIRSHPFPLPKACKVRDYSLVVERFPLRNFAADCPFIKHLGFNLMPSNILFSTFVAFTLKYISTLRCSDVSFRGFQQLK
jgi:hypothetical protein